MNLYETTFIVNPQSDDASLDRQVKSITDLITANGGKILKEDRMGTRRLAYEIQGLTQGYYTNLVFEAPAEIPSLLNRHFRLEEPYIRHLTVLFEGSLDKTEDVGAVLDQDRRDMGTARPPAAVARPDEAKASPPRKDVAESATDSPATVEEKSIEAPAEPVDAPITDSEDSTASHTESAVEIEETVEDRKSDVADSGAGTKWSSEEEEEL